VSLDAAARRRYARQLLLGEIGNAGQARLLDARFRPNEASDAEAFAVAADYLKRAGCVRDEAGDAVAVPDEAVVMRFAGNAALRSPAAAIVGAFCAVEHIKAVLGLAKARGFPTDVTLTED
jgi:hypothetical protein